MFPVMLDVRGRACLVVGGGGVALRKVGSLVEEGARVTVVAPVVTPELEALARGGALLLERRRYRPGEAAEHELVFAATDDAAVNRQVHDDATAAGVFVNVADQPDLCSFHLPARLRRGGLELAIGSAGGAPFVVSRLRRLLEARFGAEWAGWLGAASSFRSLVRSRWRDPADRERCYDRFFDGTVDAGSLAARTPSAGEMERWAQAAAGNEEQPAAAADPPPPRGFVSLVGAGPGCPGLLTLRGRQRLFEADAVAYDRLAAPALPCDLPSRVELLCVGKEAGHHPVPQEEINALLVRLASEGKRVVRFKGGDPYVFGRGSEEAEALAAAGVPFEVVPGVTAGVAVPAWAGIPLTHRREAVRVTLVTAHESAKEDATHMRWDLAARDPHATLVGYMGVTSLPNVVARLLEGGMDPATPAAVVERGTTASQRVCLSSLASLPEQAAREALRPPALFVIGPTVRHAASLDWLRFSPLAGERLAVFARDRGDLASELERGGADVVRAWPPVAPVVQVLLAALPLTGCILGSAADACTLQGEASRATWTSGATCWCLGREAAEAARHFSPVAVEELDGRFTASELARRIARSRSRP